MLLSLLRFDFTSAFESNGAILVMLPVGVAIASLYVYRYIKYGDKLLTKPSRAIVIIMISVLLIFGVIRNFSGW